MLEKKDNIKTSELLILLSFLQSENIIKNKKFRFDHLITECFSNDNGVVDVDGFLDDLMCDLFIIYNKLKNTETIEENIHISPLFKVLPKDMLEESMRGLKSFIDLYERLLMECKFENIQIRGIQKTMFTTMLNNSIMNEEYEKCIELKEKLKDV